jgi:predicted amidohydrolase YtcJ
VGRGGRHHGRTHHRRRRRAGTSATLAGPATRVIDLAGAFALPGFNDAHVHVDSTGALLTGVNLLDVHEPSAFTERIRGATTRLPKGSWITRGDWGAYEQWEAGSAGAAGTPDAAAGPFTPSRDLIDDVTPDHPVFVNRFDRSVFWPTASRCGWQASTSGRRIRPAARSSRTPTGRPTGFLRGTAADLVRRVVPAGPMEQRLVQVRAVLQEAREGGVTTMQDLTGPEQLQAYQLLQRGGELTARIMLRPQLWRVPEVAALGIGRGFGDDYLKFIGYKAWVDGIMGNSSAMFFRPYDHDPANKGQLRDIMYPEGQQGAGDALTASTIATRRSRPATWSGSRRRRSAPASRRTSTRSATRATASCSTSTIAC